MIFASQSVTPFVAWRRRGNHWKKKSHSLLSSNRSANEKINNNREIQFIYWRQISRSDDGENHRRKRSENQWQRKKGLRCYKAFFFSFYSIKIMIIIENLREWFDYLFVYSVHSNTVYSPIQCTPYEFKRNK